ncbi:MAG: hypothetical protein KF778_02355 [Rhodocyclaceae bacterium]|nr:hypothetical protein [Rhodocyclaceae bacterium]MBX3667217.1 hypothetical protein [Rhodocyclaceae bacterium]
MTSVALYDVAIARLRLPVPMAKFQVIHQMAQALASESSSRATWQALLRWLRCLKLESEVLEALAIAALARGSSILSSAELRAAIDAPSVLSDIFIARALGTPVLVHSWLKSHSGEAPAGYRSPELTEELSAGTIVPPILKNRLEDLEKCSRNQFLRQWTYEFERQVERSGGGNDGHFGYFGDSHNRDEAGHFVARRGHCARSAYLRTLALACDRWNMPVQMAQAEAMYASPADLSLLPLLPGKTPGWARDLHNARPSTALEAEAVASAAFSEVSQSEAGTLLHLNLPMQDDARYQGELELISVLAAETAIDCRSAFLLHDWLPGKAIVPRTRELTLRVDRFDGAAAFRAKTGGTLRPVLLSVFDHFVGYLHSDLVGRMPCLPANHNSDAPLIAVPRQGGMDLQLSGSPVGDLRYWNWHWRPMHCKGMGGHGGVALVLDHDAVRRLMHVEGMHIFHLWRAHVRTREKDYGDWNDETWMGSLPSL